MITLYINTLAADGDYFELELVLVQGNMTASTPGGVISDNNTFVTLSNETEPLFVYNTDFNASEIFNNLPFDQLFGSSPWESMNRPQRLRVI